MTRLHIASLCIAAVFACYPGSGWGQPVSQGVIAGAVTDASTGEPLAGVHVFLSSRLQGTTSGGEGKYRIERLTPGSYRVVASIVGYTTASVNVIVRRGERVDVDFALDPAVYELEALEVTGTQPEAWSEHLDKFKDLFFGDSRNADHTEILNEYVLSFEQDEQVFVATASEPLIIENRGLGYRLTFVLEEFREDQGTLNRFTEGSWYFQELIPEDQKELDAWENEREFAYRGSLQHLLWAMVHDRVEAEGFSIVRDQSEGSNSPEIMLHKYHPVNLGDILEEQDRSHEYAMSFPDFIRVHYIREPSRGRLFSRISHSVDQLSYLRLMGEEVIIHESGYMYASQESEGKVIVFGHLATRGVSDLLPQEYSLMRQEQ